MTNMRLISRDEIGTTVSLRSTGSGESCFAGRPADSQWARWLAHVLPARSGHNRKDPVYLIMSLAPPSSREQPNNRVLVKNVAQ
jgi:hypothetical protein